MIACIGYIDEVVEFNHVYKTAIYRLKTITQRLEEKTLEKQDAENELSRHSRDMNRVVNSNENVIKILWKGLGASMGLPIEMRPGEETHETPNDSFEMQGNSHEFLVTQITHLCPTRDNPVVRKLKTLINPSKNQKRN